MVSDFLFSFFLFKTLSVVGVLNPQTSGVAPQPRPGKGHAVVIAVSRLTPTKVQPGVRQQAGVKSAP